MVFCPKCGTSLKVEKFSDWRDQRRQWREQRREMRYQWRQTEWEEKHEKRENAFIAPLVGGLILITLGVLFYYAVTTSLSWQLAQAIFLVLIGAIILVGAIYAYTIRKRYMK
jgi:uncharacterized Zn finger protein (UPF0148 family)